jgi:hypothetical protein
MTPNLLTSAAAPTEGVELKARHCCFTAPRAICLEAAENILMLFKKGLQDVEDAHVAEPWLPRPTVAEA